MKDPLLDDINFEREALEKQRALRDIQNLQKKDFYGQILISVLVSLSIIFLAMQIMAEGVSMPVLLSQSIIIVLYILALVISQNNKILAYIIAFSTFLSTKIFIFFLTYSIFIEDIFWTILVGGAFAVFIYEAYELKKLKEKL